METARNAVLIILRGVGQVMFQAHAGTGLCFLAGIAVASPVMLAGGVIGAILGPLVAYLAKFDRNEIADGIHGFNPTLVGLATVFLLRPGSPTTWMLLVVGCVAATLITYLARRFLKFPTYTAPFIVTTWAVLAIAHAVAGPSIDVPPSAPVIASGGFFREVLRGEAEVMFGANLATGILFLVGIALSSPWHATMALMGSVVGTALAAYHGDASQPLSIGIYGYNAALAAMAIFLTRRSFTLSILAAAIATMLTEFFPKALGLPALTAPFVVASWIVLALLCAENRIFPGTS